MAKANNPTQVPVHGRFSFNNFLKRFSDTGIALLDGDFGTALRTISGAVGGEKAEPEAQAYLLLWTSMKKSLVRIFHEQFRNEAQRETLVFEHVQQFLQDAWQELPGMDLYVDRAFVQNPMKHPTSAALHHYLRGWVSRQVPLSDDEARRATALFPRYLLQEMAMTGRKDYQQLYEHLESPFNEAETKAAAIDAYQARLRREFFRPAFTDERVTLADMYVQPFFRYFKPKKEGENQPDEREGHFMRPKSKYHLKDFVKEWLSKECPKQIPNTDARILLLLGQPGQGKSSFTYFISWYLLAENPGLVQHVFLLRLRDFENSRDFLENPLNAALTHIKKYKVRNDDFSEQDLQGGLLLLDGLDEYYMNNGLKNEDIDTLLSNLHRDMRNLRGHVDFHCLITSRTNYIRLENRESSRELLIADIAEMEQEEQLAWLDLYRTSLAEAEENAKQNYLNTLREAIVEKAQEATNEKVKKIRALLRQPILLRVMVEAEANPFKGDERVTIYKKLFDHLVERKWSEDGQLKGLEKIKEDRGKKLFRKFLQAFALHILYEEKEYARRSDFEEKPLSEAFEALSKNAKDIAPEALLKNLLISFYFKEVPKDEKDKKLSDEYNNYAYEFLHKSFQEYLIAEHIWEFFREELMKRDEDEDDWKIKDKAAQLKIFELFSPRILTPEITDYLYELVSQEATIDDAVFQRSETLMAGMAEHSYLLHYDWQQLPKHRKRSTPQEQSLAVFYGLLSVNGAIVAQKTKDIAWPVATEPDFEAKREALAAPLQFLPNTRLSSDLLLLLRRNYGGALKIHLSGADLSGADLSGANLSGADLSGALLYGTYLYGADLFGVYLRGALLYGALLYGAYLSGASLSGAYLRGASLSGADLSEADLSGADLSGAYLNEADLSGADLRGADLFWADLEDANLKQAKFSPHEIYGPARNLDQIQCLHRAKNLEHADWVGTIYESYTAEDWALFRKEREGLEEE